MYFISQEMWPGLCFNLLLNVLRIARNFKNLFNPIVFLSSKKNLSEGSFNLIKSFNQLFIEEFLQNASQKLKNTKMCTFKDGEAHF